MMIQSLSRCCAASVPHFTPTGEWLPGPWLCSECGTEANDYVYAYRATYRGKGLAFAWAPVDSAFDAAQITDKPCGDYDIRGCRIMAQSYGAACAIARTIEED